MNKTILSAAVLCAFVSSVSAGTQLQTLTTTPAIVPGSPNTGGLSFNFNPPPNAGGVLTFAQFQPGVGGVPLLSTLTGVQYTLGSRSYQVYSITSPTDGRNVTVSLGGNGGSIPNASISVAGPFGGSPGIANNVNQSTVVNPLAPVSGATTAILSMSGGPVNDNANLASYIGGGTVTFTVSAIGVSTISASGGVTGSADSDGEGTVALSYIYTTPGVPEASTFAALGVLGAVGGFTFLRRRRAA